MPVIDIDEAVAGHHGRPSRQFARPASLTGAMSRAQTIQSNGSLQTPTTPRTPHSVAVTQKSSSSIMPHRSAAANLAAYALEKLAGNEHKEDEMVDVVPFVETVLEEPGRFDAEMMRHLVDVSARVDLTFQGVSFSVTFQDHDKQQVNKTILHPISGHIPVGSMVALMGPSGSGKSTLLDCLALRKTAPYDGNVLFNGRPADKFLPRVTTYVPQGDYGSGLDTVDEAMSFVQALAGRIYFPTIPEEDLDALDDQHREFLLHLLGLEGVRYSRIGDELRRGVSGGQRRRVSLAKGLLKTLGGIAFLDEPTSGLSSTDSELVMQSLRNFSRTVGVTCMVVIHQPKETIFNMFDHLILLTDGKCAYNGPVDQVKPYLFDLGVPVPININPADHILDLASPSNPDNKAQLLVDSYTKKHADKNAKVAHNVKPGTPLREVVERTFKTPDNRPVRTKASFGTQYRVLQARFFRHLYRDLDVIATTVVNNIILGLIIGLLYLDVGGDEGRERQLTVLPFLYNLVLQSAFLAFASIPNLVANRVIYLNEREAGLYGSPAYLLAYMVSSFVSGLVGILLLVTIAFFLAGLDGSDFGIVLVSVMLTFFAVDAMLSVLAVTATSLPQANGMAGALIGILALFNGFTANTETSPPGISWICFISPFYYGVQSVAVRLFDEAATDTYGLNRDWGIWGSYVILVCMTVVFRALQAMLMARLKLGA
eukprot:TRINITY_DN9288_c0_g1_i1.p1 TRINITY_DN9288_c0_g1~~TRINITY_DN9288_c0_g1_i1.p1  ORF type:complete len:711 (+),score=144.81 TRINITY_DN9288_c0_g1_i1:169-2301(+)